MKKHHNLKINEEFIEHVLSGDKTFEVRKNDRGYQKGDTVSFRTTDSKGFEIFHIDAFEITYVLSGWHIEQGYVVFGMKPIGPLNGGCDE